MLQEQHYLVSTKTYSELPCAHRQWKHKGACAQVHGWGRSFSFIFAAEERDETGFVVDFGALKWLKEFLEYNFDHTLLLCYDDPLLDKFNELSQLGACEIRIPPYGVGMEDSARWVCEWTDAELRRRTNGRAWVVAVEAREASKNSAIYTNPTSRR